MDEKLKEYWNSNKLMFFLVVIPLTLGIVAFFLRDMLFAMLAGSARKEVADARTQDAALSAQAQAAAEDAAKAQATAAAAQKRIDDRKETDVPDDWYKKKD